MAYNTCLYKVVLDFLIGLYISAYQYFPHKKQSLSFNQLSYLVIALSRVHNRTYTYSPLRSWTSNPLSEIRGSTASLLPPFEACLLDFMLRISNRQAVFLFNHVSQIRCQMQLAFLFPQGIVYTRKIWKADTGSLLVIVAAETLLSAVAFCGSAFVSCLEQQ